MLSGLFENGAFLFGYEKECRNYAAGTAVGAVGAVSEGAGAAVWVGAGVIEGIVTIPVLGSSG